MSLFIFLSVTQHVPFRYGIEIKVSSLAFLYSSQIYGIRTIFRWNSKPFQFDKSSLPALFITTLFGFLFWCRASRWSRIRFTITGIRAFGTLCFTRITRRFTCWIFTWTFIITRRAFWTTWYMLSLFFRRSTFFTLLLVFAFVTWIFFTCLVRFFGCFWSPSSFFCALLLDYISKI